MLSFSRLLRVATDHFAATTRPRSFSSRIVWRRSCAISTLAAGDRLAGAMLSVSHRVNGYTRSDSIYHETEFDALMNRYLMALIMFP